MGRIVKVADWLVEEGAVLILGRKDHTFMRKILPVGFSSASQVVWFSRINKPALTGR
jgi:hypothetical protein